MRTCPWLKSSVSGRSSRPARCRQGAVIGTGSARSALVTADLTGLSFRVVRPTRVTRVTRIDQQSLDPAADEPTRYPAGGVPDNPILGRKHRPAVAEAFGALRALAMPGTGGIFPPRPCDWGTGIDLDRMNAAAHPGTGFAHVQMTAIASDRARTVLDGLAGAWMPFLGAPPFDISRKVR